MGLFDSILGQVLGGSSPQQQKQSTSLVEGLLEMLEEPGTGGVEGLARQFQRGGLDAQMNSWIGTGDNLAITAQQILAALGQSRVSQLSQRAGIPESQGASVLAALLPVLIDKLTPNGRPPAQERIAPMGLDLLRGATLSSGTPSGTPPPSRPSGGKPRPDFSDVRSGSSSTAPAPARPAPRTYKVVAGDSLSKIAKKVYGDANQWRRIFEANRDQIKDPDKIFPGQEFEIPEA
jgi:uncharacterized protein YidB (DUF937 family)